MVEELGNIEWKHLIESAEHDLQTKFNILEIASQQSNQNDQEIKEIILQALFKKELKLVRRRLTPKSNYSVQFL